MYKIYKKTYFHGFCLDQNVKCFQKKFSHGQKVVIQKELKTRPSTECFRIVIFTRICVYAEGAPKLLFHASIYRGTQSLYRGDGRSNVAVNCRYSDQLVVSLRGRPLYL